MNKDLTQGPVMGSMLRFAVPLGVLWSIPLLCSRFWRFPLC